MSAVSSTSFTPTGSPCSGPAGVDRAARLAASASKWANARTSGSRAAIWSRQDSMRSTGLNVPARMRRTSSVAVRRLGSCMACDLLARVHTGWRGRRRRSILSVMDTDDRSPSVRVGTSPDGVLTYLIDRPPEALPAVRGRDLELAWDAARDAALSGRWGAVRGFRFRRQDGSVTDLALSDRDARCWAGAVDHTVGMNTWYGLSICLRLLALVDLLARAHWATGLLRLERGGAALHPSLL